MRFPNVLSRTPFARVQSAEAELRQLGVLRWALGVVVLARVLPMLWVSEDFFPGAAGGLSPVTVWGLWVVGLLVVCTIGLAVPITLPVLFFTYKQFDRMTHATSLSMTMLCLTWLLLIITNAGARVSLDAVLLRGRGVPGAIMRGFYRPLGIPSAVQLRAIYFIVFMAYALMHLGAWMYHLEDEAWRDGTVIRTILTSTYLSRWGGVFRDLEGWSVGAISILSWLGTAGQTLFQVGMIPLVFTKLGSRFVVTWGWLFAGLSWLFLQLSYLPVFELVLWAAIFHRPKGAGLSLADPSPARRRAAGVLVPAAGYGVLLVFVLTQTPYLQDLKIIQSHQLAALPVRLSLDVPRVFNSGDLRLGDVWPVIYRGEREQLLPYHGEEGERLAWVQWNDVFLYSSSVAWRQSYQCPQDIADRDQRLLDLLLPVVRFDHAAREVPESVYVIDYYASDGSDIRLPVSRRFERRLIGTHRIHCQGSAQLATCTSAP